MKGHSARYRSPASSSPSLHSIWTRKASPSTPRPATCTWPSKATRWSVASLRPTTRSSTPYFIQEAVQGNFENNGLEGISFYKDSLLFVGSQEDALLWTCKLDGSIVARRSLMSETSLIEEIAGLCYDPSKNWLWVTDSDACKLFLFSANTFDLLASYDIPSIENAESICIDRTHNCIWVGSDEDSPKLYKFNFTF